MIPMSLIVWTLSAPIPPDPPLPDGAQALLRKLNEPDAEVRYDAIVELRLLAARADIRGGKRVRTGAEFAPKVKGLLPHLVRAAGDEAERNRVAALYALADTLDPAAVPVLRGRLKDKSAAVRFTAACLLTEFKDAAGLDELKGCLARWRADPDAAGPFDLEHLLASLERITGKSFGPIPDDPELSSDSTAFATAQKRYRELLDMWARWWAWEPERK
jgi:hypothetical protein